MIGKTSAVISAVLLAVVLSIPASAAPIPVGDPVLLGSWGQRWEESGIGNFNKAEMFIVSGASQFEGDGLESFTDGSWSGTIVHPGYSLATGNTVNWLQFSSHWTGSPGPITFYWLAWDVDPLTSSETLKNYVRGSWSSSSGWYLAAAGNTDPDPADFARSIPDGGATLTLLGCALISLATLRRRLGS